MAFSSNLSLVNSIYLLYFHMETRLWSYFVVSATPASNVGPVQVSWLHPPCLLVDVWCLCRPAGVRFPAVSECLRSGWDQRWISKWDQSGFEVGSKWDQSGIKVGSKWDQSRINQLTTHISKWNQSAYQQHFILVLIERV
jgi:hypothetical protein